MSGATLSLLRFWYGSAEAYTAIDPKDDNTLYILSNGAIYRGETKLGITPTEFNQGLSGKVDKVSSTTADHVVLFSNTTGSIKDDSVTIVSNTISGAGSTKELASTYAVVEAVKDASGIISGSYMPKISDGTAGNIVLVGNTGTVVDGSKSVATTVGSDDTTIPTGKAVQTYVSTEIGKLGSVFNYKGTAPNNQLPTAASVGDVYLITATGGDSDNAGKEYVCVTAGDGTSTTAAYEELGFPINVDNKVNVVSGTIDHIVTFVGGSTANNIQDSGKIIGTSVANNNTSVPTGAAVVAYSIPKFSGTDNNLAAVNGTGTTSTVKDSGVSVNSGTLTNNTTSVPTDKTVKDYVDSQVTPPPAHVQLIVPNYTSNLYLKLEVYGDAAMSSPVTTYITEGTPTTGQISLGSITKVYDPNTTGMVSLSTFTTGIPNRCAGRVAVINLSGIDTTNTTNYPDSVAYIKYIWYTKSGSTETTRASSVFVYPAFTPTDPVALGYYWQS